MLAGLQHVVACWDLHPRQQQETSSLSHRIARQFHLLLGFSFSSYLSSVFLKFLHIYIRIRGPIPLFLCRFPASSAVLCPPECSYCTPNSTHLLYCTSLRGTSIVRHPFVLCSPGRGRSDAKTGGWAESRAQNRHCRHDGQDGRPTRTRPSRQSGDLDLVKIREGQEETNGSPSEREVKAGEASGAHRGRKDK